MSQVVSSQYIDYTGLSLTRERRLTNSQRIPRTSRVKTGYVSNESEDNSDVGEWVCLNGVRYY